MPIPGPRDVLTALSNGAESVEQLLAAVPRILRLLDAADDLLTRVDGLVDRIDGTRASADRIVEEAEDLVSRTTPLIDRLRPLLDAIEPPLTKLQPMLDRLAETTDPREVDAMVMLIDHLPGLARKMETDIMPVLDSLGSVAPDLHDLLNISRELNEMLGSLPILGRIKRRVDEQQAEQESTRPPAPRD